MVILYITKIAGGNFICVFESFKQFIKSQFKLNWRGTNKPQTQTTLDIPTSTSNGKKRDKVGN